MQTEFNVKSQELKQNGTPTMNDQHELSIERLKASDIPEAFWRFSVDTYDGSPTALQEVSKYAKNWKLARAKNLGLFIRGEPESQKTFLAVYTLQYLLLQGCTVRYVSMPDLVDKILRNDIRLREFITEPDFLALDNVNAEGNNFWPSALNRALTARKDEGKPTIIVTQLVKDGRSEKFELVYGPANFRLINHLAYTVNAYVDDTKQQLAVQRRKELFIEETE